MDEIYLKLLELLSTVTALKWIDMDKGQLDQERPSVAFPCSLINIEFPNTNDQGGNVQVCNVRTTLRCAFSFNGSTSLASPEATRAQSLEYIQTVQDIYKAVQGKPFKSGKFKRISQILEPRADGLIVLQISFETSFIDKTAV